MRIALISSAVLIGYALAPAVAYGQLTNGGLDVPGLHEVDLATGWTLLEDPAATNTATFATFANRTPGPTPPGSTDQVGVWLRPFVGTTFDNPRPAVDADLTQVVPAVPGLNYEMTGWARFEANYSGGFDFLPSGGVADARWPPGTASPTRTEFALEFLDAGNNVLPGSIVVDLHDDRGQTNDNEWVQHSLMAVAPGGTVNVRVRASMVDGVNSDANPQSAFFDDFSLTADGEPVPVMGAVELGLLTLIVLVVATRRMGRFSRPA